ncbi:MAG: hypothetical protein WD208_06660 [Dehalococcoidia bacterium]
MVRVEFSHLQAKNPKMCEAHECELDAKPLPVIFRFEETAFPIQIMERRV